MRVLLTCVLAAFAAVCTGGLPPAAAAATEPQAKVSPLIAELGHDDPAVRATAHERLAAMGRRAEAAMREALKNEGLKKEARERIDHILAHLEMPASGAVWRSRHGREFPQLRDGDVLAAINGKPVAARLDMYALAERSWQKHELTLWRKGKGRFKLTASLGEKIVGFCSWPDSLFLYRRYGAHGRWDRLAEEAIRIHLTARPGPMKAFDAVWKAGCRDVLLLCCWLREATFAGDTQTADRLLGFRPETLKGDYPGGLVRCGMLPYHAAHYYLKYGKTKEATAVIEKALTEAKAGGAWLGIPYLRCLQLERMRLGPAKEALAFWNQHSAEILRWHVGKDHLVVSMAHQLAAANGPQRALDFLKTLADFPAVVVLRRHYSAQLAAVKRQRPDPLRHRVLVQWLPSTFMMEAGLSYWTSVPLFAARPPLRVECQMRIASAPAAKGWYLSMATLRLTGPSLRIDHPLDSTGRLLPDDRNMAEVLRYWTRCPPVLAPRQWHTFTTDVRTGSTAMYLDGAALLRRFHDGPRFGQTQVRVHSQGCKTEYRRAKLYVYSSVKRDNDVLEESFKNRLKAFRDGDPAAAKSRTDELVRLLAGVPEAAETCRRLKDELADIEKMTSKDGLSLCTRRMLDTSLSTLHSGPWELKKGTLIGSSSASKCSLFPAICFPRDFELTGVLEVTAPSAKTCVAFYWHATSCDISTVVALWPRYRLARFGNRSGKHVDVKQIDFSSPLPFCLRVRGGKAAMFLRFGSKPDLKISGLSESGHRLVITGGFLSEKTRVRLSKLVLRHLPKDTLLDAPARLPKATTRPGGAGDQPW